MRRARRAAPAFAVGILGIGLLLGGCTTTRTAKDSGSSAQSSPGTHQMTFKLAAAKYGSVSVDVPKNPIGKAKATSFPGMEFEVYALQRRGKAVLVVFAMHNTTGQDYGIGGIANALDKGQVDEYAEGIALFDPKHLKEYLTYTQDPDNPDANCLCSRIDYNGNDFKPAERRYYIAEVAAPPTSVRTVTVYANLASVPGLAISG